MASSLALLVSVSSLALYAYSVYYLNFDSDCVKIHNLLPESLRPYGSWKFLTYQCLILQLINSLLHVLASFSRSFVGPRDLFFSTLAYPVSSIVVYSFWAVWHLMGRELIFPRVLDPYYPTWLNHSTHTIIVPVNILLAYSVQHKYSRNGILITLSYFAAYVGLLHYIKFKTGVFVYAYLEALNDNERIIYFAATGAFAYLMYKSGQLLTSAIHGSAVQKPKSAVDSRGGKKQKQK